MAIAAATVWECNAGATASNVNAGGFNPGNGNMATDLAADTNTGNTNSPVVSSASYNFAAGDVGHWIYIKAGTNWTPGWYQIASVAANKATLSAAIGAAVLALDTSKPVYKGYSPNTAAGCATVGTPTGGTWAIDYSQGTTSITTAADLVGALATGASPTLTSASKPFTKAMVGNIIHINSGTNWTQSWFEIVSVAVVTATIDRACASTASPTNGTFHVGGAMSLNSTLDDDFFEVASASGGNVFFLKNNGAFTAGENVVVSATGVVASHHKIVGYNTLRGDTPTGANRPSVAAGANSWEFDNKWDHHNYILTGTGTFVIYVGLDCLANNLKVTNTSTTAARDAIQTGNQAMVSNCEAISYRGYGINVGSGNGPFMFGNYIHSCDQGIRAALGPSTIAYNIIEGNVSYGIFNNDTHPAFIANNTLVGFVTPTGIGVHSATGKAGSHLFNNIIYGFATGASHVDVQNSGFDDYNNYYNNTADVVGTTKWQKGPHDVAIDPAFTTLAEVAGTTATAGAADNTITDSGKNFTTAGVVAGRDFFYLVSGTNCTAGIYGITTVGTTTLVLDLDPTSASTGSNIVYRILTGHNLLPTGAL